MGASDERRGGVVPAVVVAAVLVAGGWWWTWSAPVAGRAALAAAGGADPLKVSGPAVDGLSEVVPGGTVAGEPYNRVRMTIDPGTGVTYHYAPPGTAVPPLFVSDGRYVPSVVSRLLPRLPETAHREVRRLPAHGTSMWTTDTVPNGRYVLQYVCVGDGGLRLRVAGTGASAPVEATCTGVPRSLIFSARGSQLAVSVRRPHTAPAEYAVQLVRLS